jgi:hypothetical protein
MPRARAHAAARIDGAECTRALQVRRQWRRRIAPRDATGAECGASACGLTPRRRPRRRRRRRRKLLVLDDHRRHATVSSAFLRSPPVGRAFGRVGAQVRCPRRLARLRFKRPSHARSAERGARRRRLSDARSAERGAPERRAERGARCAAGFRVHPLLLLPLLLLLLLLQARLRFKRPSHARSAERGARRRRPSDARSAERWLVCRVQYECQRASSCALVATGARVCQSAGGAFDDSAGVYTGVPGERRLPLLACLWLETDGTPALGLGPLMLPRAVQHNRENATQVKFKFKFKFKSSRVKSTHVQHCGLARESGTTYSRVLHTLPSYAIHVCFQLLVVL